MFWNVLVEDKDVAEGSAAPLMSNNKTIVLGTKRNKPRSVANAFFFKCLAKRVKLNLHNIRDSRCTGTLLLRWVWSALYLFQYNETTTGEMVLDKNTTIFINFLTLCYWFKVRLSLIVKVISIPFYCLLFNT